MGNDQMQVDSGAGVGGGVVSGSGSAAATVAVDIHPLVLVNISDHIMKLRIHQKSQDPQGMCACACDSLRFDRSRRAHGRRASRGPTGTRRSGMLHMYMLMCAREDLRKITRAHATPTRARAHTHTHTHTKTRTHQSTHTRHRSRSVRSAAGDARGATRCRCEQLRAAVHRGAGRHCQNRLAVHGEETRVRCVRARVCVCVRW